MNIKFKYIIKTESSISLNIFPASYSVLFENRKPEPKTLRSRYCYASVIQLL